MNDPTDLLKGKCGRMWPAWDKLPCLMGRLLVKSPNSDGPTTLQALLDRMPARPRERPSAAHVQGGSVRIPWGEVHLWCAGLDVSSGRTAELAETLDAGERSRAAAYRFELHRNRFIAAHGALRRILSTYLGLSPDRIRYESEGWGRPQLAPEFNPCGLDFSFSHSGGLAVVAVTAHCRVGVDVEKVRDLAMAEELAGLILSEAEWFEWSRYPAEERLEALLCGWTRKEACLKADGCGLRMDPRLVPVGMDSDMGRHWSHVTPPGHGKPRWAVCSVEAMPGYLASVALAEIGSSGGVHGWPIFPRRIQEEVPSARERER